MGPSFSVFPSAFYINIHTHTPYSGTYLILLSFGITYHSPNTTLTFRPPYYAGSLPWNLMLLFWNPTHLWRLVSSMKLSVIPPGTAHHFLLWSHVAFCLYLHHSTYFMLEREARVSVMPVPLKTQQPDLVIMRTHSLLNTWATESLMCPLLHGRKRIITLVVGWVADDCAFTIVLS